MIGPIAKELVALIGRVNGIVAEKNEAEALIYRADRAATDMIPATASQYDSYKLTRHAMMDENTIAAVREITRQHLVAKATDQRNARVRKLAAELDSISRYLPGLCARAAIEMGATARAMTAALPKEDTNA